MGVFQEFREFISRGSVVDLAVGVIIGGAFGKIITSLVDNVIMPPIGMVLGRVDFAQLRFLLQPADPARHVSEVAVSYGLFLNTIIQFLIVAFVIFLLIKGINSMRRKEAEAPAQPEAPTTSEALLTEIRDLLKTRAAP